MPEKRSQRPRGGNLPPVLELGLVCLVARLLLLLFLIGHPNRSARARIGATQRKLLLAEIGPVVVVRAGERDDNRVQSRAQRRRHGAVHARQGLARRDYRDLARERVCRAEPDSNTRAQPEDGRDDGCRLGLLLPEDGENGS